MYALSQVQSAPQRLDDLLTREAAFRHYLAAGDRVKASELVVASKRKDFLNQPPAALENFQLVGIDFVDKDHVSVRVTGQNVVSGGNGAQLVEPQVVDAWIRDKGNWFLQPDTGEHPFSGMFKKSAGADEVALTEIKSSFKLLSPAIDVGDVWQGDRKDVAIPFQYTGDSPIRIVSKVDSPVTMLDNNSTQRILKDAREFKIIAGSDDFDGPFDIPVGITIYYKSIALDESVRVKGNIRPLFRYKQEPATIPPDSKQEFSLFITNNTDEVAEFDGLVAEGAFDVTKFLNHLAPGEEGVITLKRNSSVPKPGTVIRLSLGKGLKGKREFDVRIH
jgi:hypothetical protein